MGPAAGDSSEFTDRSACLPKQAAPTHARAFRPAPFPCDAGVTPLLLVFIARPWSMWGQQRRSYVE